MPESDEVDVGAVAYVKPGNTKPVTFKEAKRQAKQFATEVLLLSQLKPGEKRRQCKAVRKNGKRCAKFSIRGGFVCMTHGGASPLVRKKANRRLLAMVEPSLIELEALVHQDVHLPTKLGAIRTVLERAGAESIGVLKTDTGEKDTRPIINIGIAAGGVPRPQLMEVNVSTNLLPSAKTAAVDDVDGEVVADEDEE